MYRYILLDLILFGLVSLTFLIYQLKLPSKKTLVWLGGILLVSTIIFDWYLTTLPLVRYNSNSLLGLFLGPIPLEDFAYVIVVILVGPALYEYFYEQAKHKN